MAAVLRLVGATVVRGERPILDRVDLTVNADERWVILGPNGAGKTTLLEVMATLNHPTSGSVEILGNPLGLVNVFELRPLIGVVLSRTTSLIPDAELARDVVITAGWAQLGRFRESYEQLDLDRCEELLSLMGVRHLSSRSFGSLSDGERQRVLVARSLFPDPELLLLDEPAAGLDLGAREGLLERLSVLACDRAAPVQIMITHHVEEIPAGFSHAMLLRDAHVLTQGPIDEVLTDENLTKAFDTPLTVRKVFSRFWAFAA